MIHQVTHFTCDLCGSVKTENMSQCDRESSHEDDRKIHYIDADQPSRWQVIQLNGSKLICNICLEYLTNSIESLKEKP